MKNLQDSVKNNVQDISTYLKNVLDKRNNSHIYNSVDSVLSAIDCVYKSRFKSGDTRKSFYVGITGDKDATLQRHKIKKFAGIFKCETADLAAKVELEARKHGYYIGETKTEGNGGNEKSVFVYIFRMDKNTMPPIDHR